MYVCIREIIRLIIMKMKIKMKNRSHRYQISIQRSRHGHKYSKYKKCLSMMVLFTYGATPKQRVKLNS